MKFAKVSGLLAAIAVASCASDPPSLPPADVVAFGMSPVLSATGKIEALRIEVRFRGDEDGLTEGRFQARVSNSDDLLRNYTDITVSGGVMRQSARSGAWTIEAPPLAPIVLSYLLRSGIDGPPTSKHSQPPDGSLTTQRVARIPGSPSDPKQCGLG
jgi:hypothetical protein